MPISVFDPEHQEKLRKFDTDGGGKLDADEVVNAFVALQKALDASAKGTIPFENFPEEMQKKLATLDDTGDGQVCPSCHHTFCQSQHSVENTYGRAALIFGGLDTCSSTHRRFLRVSRRSSARKIEPQC
jgi:hypothetical protein